MISKTLLDATARFEGLRLKAYRCPAGIWTIGYGHTRGVTPDMVISKATALKWLEADLREAQRVVLNNTKGIQLSQPQLEALTDFVFNIGATKFKLSTLLRKLKAGAPAIEVATEFSRWGFAGKTRLPGLERRRAWEMNRFMTKV